MDGKQVGQYRRLLRHIKRQERQVTRHRFAPTKVICDFEAAIIAAIETKLPNSRVRGCYFHFCQSLWRKIQELGLAGAYRRRRKLRKCLQKCMAIGYLPLALVDLNFGTFLTSRTVARCCLHHPELRQFMRYLRQNYIRQNALFPTRIWNVFDRNSDTRTNNYVESEYHMKVVLLQ
jgi:hypothetical protein